MPGPPARQPRWGGVRAGGHGKPTASIGVSSRWGWGPSASGRRRFLMAKTATRGIDLEPIDRLEEKLKRLVSMVERMKADQARAVEENQRLSRELDAMFGRLAASDTVAHDLVTLKEEREVIRTRVGEMLEQLEALNL